MTLTVQVTQRGINQTGKGGKLQPVPVGTQLTCNKLPAAWVNKVRVIGGGDNPEPATPDPDLEALRKEYTELTGNSPGRMKPETLRQKIDEALEER